MSVITGVVLSTSCAEDYGSSGEAGPPALFERINEWLAGRRDYWRLTMVQDHFAGGKHPQICVAGGGFNYFPEDEFAGFVLGLPWEYPEEVVLIIHPEEGAARVFRPPYLNLQFAADGTNSG